VQWYFVQTRQNYGFGPTLFGNPDYNCSFLHPQFRYCYIHACQLALEREYGCAVNNNDNNNNNHENNTCTTPYHTTLLQTREPWKIVTSLVAKYCLDDDNNIRESPPKTLQWLLHALGLVQPDDHCVLQMIDYVTGYYNTILDHSSSGSDGDGDDHLAIYPIESTSPCEVATLAGLGDPATTVYAPNQKEVQRKCRSMDNDNDNTQKNKNGPHEQRTTTTTTTTSSSRGTIPTKKSNVINRGRVSIQDLLPYTTPKHLERLKALYSRLGYYDYKEEE
jgi:hypothetical protein